MDPRAPAGAPPVGPGNGIGQDWPVDHPDEER
jgi:hypothetical protein